VIAAPLQTTVAEIMTMLSDAKEANASGARKITSGMKIHLRERGQGGV